MSAYYYRMIILTHPHAHPILIHIEPAFVICTARMRALVSLSFDNQWLPSISNAAVDSRPPKPCATPSERTAISAALPKPLSSEINHELHLHGHIDVNVLGLADENDSA